MFGNLGSAASPLPGANASWVQIQTPEGSAVLCSHCNSVAFRLLGDDIIIVHRHHGQYHKTVMPLKELGFVRVA